MTGRYNLNRIEEIALAKHEDNLEDVPDLSCQALQNVHGFIFPLHADLSSRNSGRRRAIDGYLVYGLECDGESIPLVQRINILEN